MNKLPSVIVRDRQGTNSLDITIPVKVARKYSISPGDVFILKVSEKDNNITLEYQRIFQQKRE